MKEIPIQLKLFLHANEILIERKCKSFPRRIERFARGVPSVALIPRDRIKSYSSVGRPADLAAARKYRSIASVVMKETIARGNDCRRVVGARERLPQRRFRKFRESTTLRGDKSSLGGVPQNDLGTSDSPYRTAISGAILKLQETGKLHMLKTRWWKEKRGGGSCRVS